MGLGVMFENLRGVAILQVQRHGLKILKWVDILLYPGAAQESALF